MITQINITITREIYPDIITIRTAITIDKGNNIEFPSEVGVQYMMPIDYLMATDGESYFEWEWRKVGEMLKEKLKELFLHKRDKE